MTENEITIGAPRETVFAVLADAKRYADWVVGTAEIRDADVVWPAPGAKLYHSVGAGPLRFDDHTEVLACEAPGRLVLLAHLGPLGDFKVDLRLDDAGGGTTRVVMLEGPVKGISRVAGPAGDAFGSVRNALSLRRLKDIAES
ncbi:MAG TPA: SRPBCC family protein [Gaiellaceae bacterium]|nr:SRPBCC family protein [Gaiellaceae bacterium]